MALWGTTDADEAKPKWLTADQKTNVFATAAGWTQLNGKGLEEVICAIGGLSGALGASDITAVRFVQTSYAAGSRAISVDVTFNEKVVVAGTPQLVVDNANNSTDGNGDYTLSYASGTGTNKLRFTAASQTVSATDVLAIGGGSPSASAVTLNSGTITAAEGDKLGAVTIAAATTGSTTFPTASVVNDVDFITVGTVNTLVAKVHSAAVVAGGTGYSAGQEITIASGFGTGTAAVLTIATVTGGAVTSVTVKAAAPGVYSAIASGVAGIGQQSVSAGSGSGATFNLTLAVATLAINAAGAGYEAAPSIALAGTGLVQNATVSLVGSAVALATTGATQQLKTVVA
tara:strand:+ start:20 stop:1051 length:1032 start_codon:yes stop_codon:yes gene_type:complete